MKLINQARAFFSIPTPMPEIAFIEITNQCNLRCRMCRRKYFLDKHLIEDNHISVSAFQAIISRLSGIEWLSLSGVGEPFIHPNFFTLLEEAKAAGYKVATSTNGFWRNNLERNIAEINRIGLDELRISVDDIQGTNPFGHPMNVKEIERIISSVNCPVEINTVISLGNIDQLQRILTWANDQGCCVDFYDLMWEESNMDPVWPEQKRVVMSRLKGDFRSVEKRKRGVRGLAYRRWTRCPWLHNVLSIRMNGDVVLCNCGADAILRVLGNVFETPVVDIWKRMQSLRMSPISKIPECRDCTLFWEKKK
jgi:radical SAM protein with 4Fe4S-binding SPASM domain